MRNVIMGTMKVMIAVVICMMVITSVGYQSPNISAKTAISFDKTWIEEDDVEDMMQVEIPNKFEEDSLTDNVVVTTLVTTPCFGGAICVEYVEMSIVNDIIGSNVVGSFEYSFTEHK